MSKESSYLDMSESGNWNAAKHYSERKIVKYLIETDIYYTIAKYGCLDIQEEFIMDPILKDEMRVKAIYRLTTTLQILCDNTKFAVRAKDKEKIQEFIEELDNIEAILPEVAKVKIDQDQNQKSIKLDKKKFKEMLEDLRKIKREKNTPLNKADKIFTNYEN